MCQDTFLEAFRFDQEKVLTQRLRDILYADLLEPIFEKCKYPLEKDYWRSIFEGRGFRLTEKLAPRLHQICQEVKEILKFDEHVEFFVTHDPTINALSYLRQADQHSHLIVFTSGLVEKFTDVELRFVIGHELAHIIYKTSQLKRLLFNLYPDKNQIALPVQNLIRIWDKFAEISADRLGFIAAPDLESCVRNFFKLSSGLSMEKVDFTLGDYLNEVDTILEKYTQSGAFFNQTHPTNPIRVKAIQLFSESKLYKSFKKDGTIIENDVELSKAMDSLVELLELHPDNERDYYRLTLIAVGGFMMAGIDQEITKDEEERIIENLSNFIAYPRAYLKGLIGQIQNHEEMMALFIESIRKLLEIDPEERYAIFNYLCDIAISDRALDKNEIWFLIDIATRLLGFYEIEANRLFLERLKSFQFRPRF